MLLVLIVAGILGKSHVGPLDDQLHRNAGYSMDLLIRGEVHRAITSLFFTAGGWRFYASLVMFALAVGWVEWQQGTRRSAATFFGVHFATLAIMIIGVAIWVAVSNTHRGNLLWNVQDVGPSAGYYGCLGLAIAGLSPAIRTPAMAGIASLLAVRLVWSFLHLPEEGRVLSADTTHLIAFPLGILAHRVC